MSFGSSDGTQGTIKATYLRFEDNKELADKVGRQEEQPWKRWFLFADEHPLETGKYNYGGFIVRKPPAIMQYGQFIHDRILSPIHEQQIFQQLYLRNSIIISYWIRKLSFIAAMNIKSRSQTTLAHIQIVIDPNIIDIIIKYTLYIPLTWHPASTHPFNPSYTPRENENIYKPVELHPSNPNMISICNDGVNIALMNYICDWNHLYMTQKEETFGVKLTLSEFNDPIAFGFGFIVVNHLTLTPYIGNWNHFMDFGDTNIGFGVFFVRQKNVVDDNGGLLNNVYSMIAFCEPRLYQNYLIEKWFPDGGLVQLNKGDDIKIIINHKTETSCLYVNDQKISDIFFGTPPYIAPAIHYVGQENRIKCTFQCDFCDLPLTLWDDDANNYKSGYVSSDTPADEQSGYDEYGPATGYVRKQDFESEYGLDGVSDQCSSLSQERYLSFLVFHSIISHDTRFPLYNPHTKHDSNDCIQTTIT